MTPVTRVAILAVLAFYFTACGSKSDSGAAPMAPQTKAEDGKLKLKSAGVKKVMIGSEQNLTKYLLNAQGATYSVIEGGASVQWASVSEPILRFKEGGAITVLVQSADTNVALKFKVVFDETALIGGPDLELPEMPGVDL